MESLSDNSNPNTAHSLTSSPQHIPLTTHLQLSKTERYMYAYITPERSVTTSSTYSGSCLKPWNKARYMHTCTYACLTYQPQGRKLVRVPIQRDSTCIKWICYRSWCTQNSITITDHLRQVMWRRALVLLPQRLLAVNRLGCKHSQCTQARDRNVHSETK